MAKNLPSAHHRTTLSNYIFATKIIGKNLVKQQYLLQMLPQYGELCPLAAEISPVVWGTPANVNGFCVLAELLHGTVALNSLLCADVPLRNYSLTPAVGVS